MGLTTKELLVIISDTVQRNLSRLDLSDNQLTTLPPEITQLTNLNTLILSGNPLTTLPPEIAQLTHLNRLDLRDNQLTTLPPEIAQLTNLNRLDLSGNPIPLPPEIIAKTHDPAAVINYYLQHQEGQKQSLNEAKLLLVGQGTVGKTSLVNRLIDDTYDPHEDKTEGIDIRRWSIQVGEQDIHLNVWDFGGQEIMHATHQFFLTKRSLYVLVLDARQGEEENRVEYWLKIIQSFSAASPVIIVGNKIDQQRLDIDRSGLRKKYKNIKGIVETSCVDGRGMDKLKTTITRELGRLDHIHDPLLLTWFRVKTQLEELDRNYLPYDEYIKLCLAEDITDDTSQRTLIGFLHDLGIVLNFRDDPRLETTNILNPEWVTNGVYAILNSNELLTEYGGMLELSMLSRLLDPHAYPRDKHPFIIDMMRKFELCFDLEGFAGQKVLIPDLLTKEEPDTGEWVDALLFQYHYNVLPGSIVSRFIVRMNAHISQKTYWRNGVVLKHDGNRALVRADREDKKIYIAVSGSLATRRNLLAIIRSQFEAIHQTISGIEAKQKVPVPDHPDIVVDYEHLRMLENMGETSLIPSGLSERVIVKQLLDGVESARNQQWRGKENMHDEPSKPTRSGHGQNTPRAPPIHRQSPWSSGLFFLLSIVMLLVIIATIANFVPWYVLPVVIIGAILALCVMGALQLRQDEKLAQTGFLKLMLASLQSLPLLRSDKSAKKSE